MTAEELYERLSRIPKRKRRFVEVMVARAHDHGLSIGPPAHDREGWNYPIVEADSPNELLFTLRWVAEDRP